MVYEYVLNKQCEHLQNYKHNIHKVKYKCWGSLSDRKKETSVIVPSCLTAGIFILPFQPPTSEPLSLSHETHEFFSLFPGGTNTCG